MIVYHGSKVIHFLTHLAIATVLVMRTLRSDSAYTRRAENTCHTQRAFKCISYIDIPAATTNGRRKIVWVQIINEGHLKETHVIRLHVLVIMIGNSLQLNQRKFFFKF